MFLVKFGMNLPSLFFEMKSSKWSEVYYQKFYDIKYVIPC